MVYRIDKYDAIVYADGAFRSFAAAIGDPGLAERVLGEPLWSFIADPELCSLHLALVGSARSGRTITVRTRCDSPHMVRSVALTFAPRAGGEVELSCRLAGAALIGVAPGRGDEMLRVCAWCYRAERDGWRDIEEVVSAEQLLERPHVPRITHGICDSCLAEVAAGFEHPGEPAASRS
ncbi:MAG: hypothetical protein QOJ07_957 [Thermoleophilaceae bacterium]|nr:hypothetical protein [Thermoleophilaceae bacterium]